MFCGCSFNIFFGALAIFTRNPKLLVSWPGHRRGIRHHKDAGSTHDLALDQVLGSLRDVAEHAPRAMSSSAVDLGMAGNGQAASRLIGS